MPRDHLEFIQAQSLPWLAKRSHYNGVDSKTLSQDNTSGARSSIIRFKKGWRHQEPHSLDCDEEFYVLQGTIRIGTETFSVGDYAYLPAGHVREGVDSTAGCDILSFTESRASLIAPGMLVPDTGYLIPRLDTSSMPWSAATDPNVVSSSVGRKLLRPDTTTGERTWLLKLETNSPYEINGVERHPCVEEMFLLDGDLVLAAGEMRRGAYFWRPPNIPHGPTGSRRGFMALFRAKEGAFSTEWSEATEPVNWQDPDPEDPIEPY